MSTVAQRLHDAIERPGQQRLDLAQVATAVILTKEDAEALSLDIARNCVTHHICDHCHAQYCWTHEIGDSYGWCFHGRSTCPSCKGDCPRCAEEAMPRVRAVQP